MHWPKAAGRIRDRGWNVYSCPWILGLTARLVLASKQAEPASEPGNRSLSSIRMHCQYRKFMQDVHAVASSNDCRERSTACRTQGTPNGCGPQQRRANLARISRPQPGQTYLGWQQSCALNSLDMALSFDDQAHVPAPKLRKNLGKRHTPTPAQRRELV